jgi:hypothetical protein
MDPMVIHPRKRSKFTCFTSIKVGKLRLYGGHTHPPTHPPIHPPMCIRIWVGVFHLMHVHTHTHIKLVHVVCNIQSTYKPTHT